MVALYAGSRVVSAPALVAALGAHCGSCVSAARSMNDGAYAVGLLTEVVVESNEPAVVATGKVLFKEIGLVCNLRSMSAWIWQPRSF